MSEMFLAKPMMWILQAVFLELAADLLFELFAEVDVVELLFACRGRIRAVR